MGAWNLAGEFERVRILRMEFTPEAKKNKSYPKVYVETGFSLSDNAERVSKTLLEMAKQIEKYERGDQPGEE